MKLNGQSQKPNLEALIVNLKAIKRYPFLVDLLAAANKLDPDGMIEVIERAISEPLADPCWICPVEPCKNGEFMVLVGTDGRMAHVCSGAAPYRFDYREWWNTPFFDLRRKYMIRVVEPPNFAFEAAFKMRLMPNPPRELPERYLMELRPDPSTGILFWVTPKAVDMKGMKVIRVLLQRAT